MSVPRRKPSTKGIKVTAFIHPRNYAVLKAEAKKDGRSLSATVNDATVVFRRMHQGMSPLG